MVEVTGRWLEGKPEAGPTTVVWAASVGDWIKT